MNPGKVQGQQREYSGGRREGLCRGNAHFRASVQGDATVDFPGDRAADRIDDPEYLAAFALDLLDCGERVVGLARLADPDVQGAFLDDRPAVPELRGWLGVR